MSLQLSGVVWRSSWGLGSCGSTTRRTSSSPIRRLRPAQTIHLKPIKGCTWFYTQAKDLRMRRLDRLHSQADHDKNSVVI
ncbi:hypothetical protein Taro_039887 [Colocasia esculenta]|uniref:Uncharacterized protein n=1 Tax=Colocasia esculenta TaxID=4460 RepID=A0A843W7K3_COLES|nr:hypothetical protein [Colocasia esculenta]